MINKASAAYVFLVMVITVSSTAWMTAIVNRNANLINENAAASRRRHEETMGAIAEVRREGVERTKFRFTSEDAKPLIEDMNRLKAKVLPQEGKQ